MRELLKNEYTKFSKAIYVWIIVVVPVLICIISFCISNLMTTANLEFLMEKTGIRNPWVFVEVTPLTLLSIILPLITCGLCAYNYDVEQQAYGWNKMLSYPFSGRLVLLAKAISMSALLLGSLIFSLILSIVLNKVLILTRPEFQLDQHQLNHYVLMAAGLFLVFKCFLVITTVNLCLFHIKQIWPVAIVCGVLFSVAPLLSFQNFDGNLIDSYSNQDIGFVFREMLGGKMQLMLGGLLVLVLTLYKYAPAQRLTQ
ncbi:ABC transporter permease [Pedobacter sp. PLR]|uniref:ABC transporter permease n=1 Tax=Pedobacter sp. PLR TaxID=2994465 RepID=UPI00224808E6|nr:ABC transporter permease [Pedobacter sp. PLR]MCX2449765.1 ABC transporter permease [Pedobacter sp. PLR]